MSLGRLPATLARPSTGGLRLQRIAFSFYSSLMEVPSCFKVDGSCRSLLYTEHGAPCDVLKMESGFIMQSEQVDAQSRDKLVHVKMLAAPINPADINQIQGNYPLNSPGSWHVGGNEGVGRVVAVAPSVTSLSVGDLVIPNSGALGTWREQLIVHEADLHAVPPSLPLEVAATLLVNPPTAYRMLADFVNVRPNDVIIQNGANSAVGRYVIQMAKLRGIHTINIVRDRPDYETLERELLSLGATTVVKAEKFSLPETQAYLASLFSNQRPLLGLNCVSGLATIDMANFLADGASLVTYGGMSKKNPIVTASSLIFRDIKFVGFWMSRWYSQAKENSNLAREREEMFGKIIEMFTSGHLKTPSFNKIAFSQHWQSVINHYSGGAVPKDAGGEFKPLFTMNQ